MTATAARHVAVERQQAARLGKLGYRPPDAFAETKAEGKMGWRMGFDVLALLEIARSFGRNIERIMSLPASARVIVDRLNEDKKELQCR